MQESLLPTLISKDSPNYSAVEELKEALVHANTDEGKRIRNIALTGPYGSGKSSILYTLRSECEKANPESEESKLKFLPISLALLKGIPHSISEEESDNEHSSLDDNSPEKVNEELLNRRIEYSILQQLVFREKSSTVPGSRIKRINPPDRKMSIGFLVTVLLLAVSLFVLLELSFLKVDTICDLLNFGRYNVIFDLAALCYIVWFGYKYIVPQINEAYHRFRIEKIEVHGAEIKMNGEKSIFNEYLDEILYFFCQTEYNVVLIEDLDRFSTTSIFLKLRELSMLINESKIVNRHVTFVFAIKDDMFKDEDRTKFFDQMFTVIPFINSSNSKNLLKKKLEENGISDKEIPDDDISDMAFFIHEMRILINIVNEFCQYRKRLNAEGNNRLDMTNLLAMIIYKNLYPRDFTLLHRRQGMIYSALQQRDGIEQWLKSRYEKEDKELKEWGKLQIQNRDKTEVEIRISFIHHLLRELGISNAFSILVGGEYRSITDIADSKDLFDKLLQLNDFDYGCWNSYRRYESSRLWRFDNTKISNSIKNFRLKEKLKSIRKDHKDSITRRESELAAKYSEVSNKSLAYYLSYFPEVRQTPDFQNIKLPDMLLLFLQEGYIDENYYDYISFFHDGMLSETDNEWLLSVKLRRLNGYRNRIDHKDNIVKSLRLAYFEHESVLNIELLDYLYENRAVDKISLLYDAFMKHLKNPNIPQDFILCYAQFGKYKDEILEDYFKWDEETTWIVANEGIDENIAESLRVLWCKYTVTLPECVQEWMEANFSFLTLYADEIRRPRIKDIVAKCVFEKLSSCEDWLLNEVIENDSYLISAENIDVLLKSVSVDYDGKLNFASIMKTGNSSLIDYLTHKEYIEFTLDSLMKKKMEEESGCVFVINNPNLSSDQKRSYLCEQPSKISSLIDVELPYQRMVMEQKLILPSWSNILEYYIHHGLDDTMTDFIEETYQEIRATVPSDQISEVDEGWKMCNDLFVSKSLSMDTHAALLSAVSFIAAPTASLAKLNEERFLKLLEHNAVPYDNQYLDLLGGTDNLGRYLEYHSTICPQDIPNRDIDINLHSSQYLIKSKKISISFKESILQKLDYSIVCQSVILKDFAGACLLKSTATLDWSGNEIHAIIHPRMPYDMKMKLWMLAMSTDAELIPEILPEMGEEYADILISNKRPKYPNDEYHQNLLTLLKSKGYIKSFHDRKDILRAYH